MRIEGGVNPLLGRGRRIRRTENLGNLRKGLVVADDSAAAAKIGSDHVAKQLHQRLPIAQDSRFQRVAQDRVRNDQRQD